MNAGRVVVCGAVAQKPRQPGHTWQFLQYLLGFRRLGYEVLLVDRLATPEPNLVDHVRSTLDRFDLAWTIAHDDGVHSGLPRPETLAWVRSADLLLNVMGFCTDEELLAAARHRVFLDTDPGFGQMWHALGLADVLAGHDTYVTIGQRIGTPDCSIPACGLRWGTTLQPVVLDDRNLARRLRADRVPGPPLRAASPRVSPLRRAPPHHRPPVRAGTRHRSGRQRRSPASPKRRFQPRRSLLRHDHARRLSPLRAKQLGGVDGGEGDVRGEPQRLVQ
jgi:hypothetical protein